ncbi:MAG: hypothetical protein HRT88_10780, partial [Lentisphaeraceae bacterium]|nr:hypothetical protein [Lentisphaeraceae bacterium]
MTISEMASVETQSMVLSDFQGQQFNVTANGLLMSATPVAASSLPSFDESSSQKNDFTVDELREMDKDVRRRRDAQVLLGGGTVLHTETFFHEGFAVDVALNVDLSRESTPEGTIRKMRNVLNSMRSVASPTPKDTAMSLMAMAIMN